MTNEEAAGLRWWLKLENLLSLVESSWWSERLSTHSANAQVALVGCTVLGFGKRSTVLQRATLAKRCYANNSTAASRAEAILVILSVRDSEAAIGSDDDDDGLVLPKLPEFGHFDC